MHFLDAWSELSPFDLARLLVPMGCLAAATFLPGGRIARIVSVGIAAAVPFLRELSVSAWVVAGWTALWLVVAWRTGNADEAARRPLAATRNVLESGTVALLLGLVLLALLVAAVARQDMSPEDGRRASYGIALLGLGLLHLMIRRHLRRALVGFAALGLGLQVLDGAARGAQLQTSASSGGSVLLATALVVAVALRIADGRERHAGTAWVSDAHDLHD